jgi:hypothetical protein
VGATILALVPLVLVLQPHFGELGDDVLPDLPGVAEVVHAREETQDLMAARAAAGPELEAAPREMVEHGHPLCHLGRVVDLGQRVEDARADVGPLGGVGQIAEDHVIGREVGVLVEEVVLAGPDVLDPGPVGGDGDLELSHEHPVLGVRGRTAAGLGQVPLNEDSELHGSPPPSLPAGRMLRRIKISDM